LAEVLLATVQEVFGDGPEIERTVQLKILLCHKSQEEAKQFGEANRWLGKSLDRNQD
jgi:hypothetical protein